MYSYFNVPGTLRLAGWLNRSYLNVWKSSGFLRKGKSSSALFLARSKQQMAYT